MPEVTLKIPEEKFLFMLELFEQLWLEIATEYEIPEWQKNVVRERIAEYEKNPKIGTSWKEARKQIKFKEK